MRVDTLTESALVADQDMLADSTTSIDRQITHDDDAQLLGRFLSGDDAAFTVLVQRHEPALRAWCLRAESTSEHIDEAIQRTLFDLSADAAQVRDASRLGAWLRTVAGRHLSRLGERDRQRRALHQPLTEHSALVELDEPFDGVRRTLLREVDLLPERERHAVHLRLREQLSNQQIAERLQIPVGSVSRHFQRAFELLRPRLQTHGIATSAALLMLIGCKGQALAAELAAIGGSTVGLAGGATISASAAAGVTSAAAAPGAVAATTASLGVAGKIGALGLGAQIAIAASVVAAATVTSALVLRPASPAVPLPELSAIGMRGTLAPGAVLSGADNLDPSGNSFLIRQPLAPGNSASSQATIIYNDRHDTARVAAIPVVE